jgi:hypothetical protein
LLYYADRQREIQPKVVLEEIAETLTRAATDLPHATGDRYQWALKHHGELVGAAIALGEIHQAVADSLCPESDESFAETDRLSEAGTLIGRCVFRSWRLLRSPRSPSHELGKPHSRCCNAPFRQHVDLLLAAREAVSRLAMLELTPRLEVRVPEGYAYYSLFPEMYFRSLHEALQSATRPLRYTVIGIRSIGTSLATLVAGALLEQGIDAVVETLRPRGHPFDRFVILGPQLRRRLADACANSLFLVVDEGPGLTCSSFLSVCSALEGVGAVEGQIAALSAWPGAPSVYASDDLRTRWQQLSVFSTDAAEAFDGWRGLVPFMACALSHDISGEVGVQDLSYGRWRELAYSSQDDWPAIYRPAERTKLLLTFDGGQRILAKFAGLGEYGKEKASRGTILAAAGFAPPVEGLTYGFLLQQYVDGRPLSSSDLSEPILARLVQYYAFLARRFCLPPRRRFRELTEMITLNAHEAAGLEASAIVGKWRLLEAEVDALPLVRLDGRPHPHEWLEVCGPGGVVYLKTDGSDHFRDHTLVGDQNILWDLAGACEEWEMGPREIAFLAGLWETEAGDAGSIKYLDFYRAAYLAFRTAALHYAIHSTNEEDVRHAFQHQQWKVNERLTQLLMADD